MDQWNHKSEAGQICQSLLFCLNNTGLERNRPFSFRISQPIVLGKSRTISGHKSCFRMYAHWEYNVACWDIRSLDARFLWQKWIQEVWKRFVSSCINTRWCSGSQCFYRQKNPKLTPELQEQLKRQDRCSFWHKFGHITMTLQEDAHLEKPKLKRKGAVQVGAPATHGLRKGHRVSPPDYTLLDKITSNLKKVLGLRNPRTTSCTTHGNPRG
jgi:hypothetical protein